MEKDLESLLLELKKRYPDKFDSFLYDLAEIFKEIDSILSKKLLVIRYLMEKSRLAVINQNEGEFSIKDLQAKTEITKQTAIKYIKLWKMKPLLAEYIIREIISKKDSRQKKFYLDKCIKKGL